MQPVHYRTSAAATSARGWTGRARKRTRGEPLARPVSWNVTGPPLPRRQA